MINPYVLWFDYQVWLMLQMKFMTPAYMIAKNDDMQEFMKQFSLNGIKSRPLQHCKPEPHI
jgi:hypothetical protein